MAQEQELGAAPTIQSLDPRVTRLQIPDGEAPEKQELQSMDNFQTFEVLHQPKRGGRYQHVGSVHAPNAAMAFLYAKEQYGRRFTTANIWVVETTDIHTINDEDTDMFATAPEKDHRSPGAYKVRDRINEYKKRHGN